MTPPRILIRVLLPAPFSPTSACTSPNWAVRLPEVRARTPPNERVMSSASIAGLVLVTFSQTWTGRSEQTRPGGHDCDRPVLGGPMGGGRSGLLGTLCP